LCTHTESDLTSRCAPEHARDGRSLRHVQVLTSRAQLQGTLEVLRLVIFLSGMFNDFLNLFEVIQFVFEDLNVRHVLCGAVCGVSTFRHVSCPTI